MVMVLVFATSLPFTFITSCNIQMAETNRDSRVPQNRPLCQTPGSCLCLVSCRETVVPETGMSVAQEECVVRKVPVE